MKYQYKSNKIKKILVFFLYTFYPPPNTHNLGRVWGHIDLKLNIVAAAYSPQTCVLIMSKTGEN